MREEHNEHEMPSKLTRGGLSIVAIDGLRTDRGIPSRKVVKCFACLHQTESTDGHENCEMCGAALCPSESAYSGYEPHLLRICPDVYSLKPPVRTVDQRRYPRIPCRNVKAYIKTEGPGVVVDLVNISRGGVCFTSVADFRLGTKVLIATHYIEGGHNIFQAGRIVRVQSKATAFFPGEYAIEFL